MRAPEALDDAKVDCSRQHIVHHPVIVALVEYQLQYTRTHTHAQTHTRSLARSLARTHCRTPAGARALPLERALSQRRGWGRARGGSHPAVASVRCASAENTAKKRQLARDSRGDRTVSLTCSLRWLRSWVAEVQRASLCCCGRTTFGKFAVGGKG